METIGKPGETRDPLRKWHWVCGLLGLLVVALIYVLVIAVNTANEYERKYEATRNELRALTEQRLPKDPVARRSLLAKEFDTLREFLQKAHKKTGQWPPADAVPSYLLDSKFGQVRIRGRVQNSKALRLGFGTRQQWRSIDQRGESFYLLSILFCDLEPHAQKIRWSDS